MNPHPYRIANPAPNASAVRRHRGESFDVYGPWEETPYSWVAWHSQPVDLPAEIVSRFHGKTMAVTGYEVDIVRQAANGSEMHVPCYELYNHHYSGWMYSSTMVRSPDDDTAEPLRTARRCRGGGARVDASSPARVDGVPTVQVFSEGSEHRRSFKGTRGYAQPDPVAVDVGERR